MVRGLKQRDSPGWSGTASKFRSPKPSPGHSPSKGERPRPPQAQGWERIGQVIDSWSGLSSENQEDQVKIRI